MKPGERQFWRVLNASADTYMNLAVEYDGKRQLLGLVSLDGVPLRFGEPDSEGYISEQTNIFISPAGRAEFLITGPPEGVTGRLATFSMYRGADDDGRPVARRLGEQPALRIGQDDIDPSRPLATIVAAADVSSPKAAEASSSAAAAELEFQPLSSVRPVRKRTLFFSEKLVNPADPKSATRVFHYRGWAHASGVRSKGRAQHHRPPGRRRGLDDRKSLARSPHVPCAPVALPGSGTARNFLGGALTERYGQSCRMEWVWQLSEHHGEDGLSGSADCGNVPIPLPHRCSTSMAG